MFLDRVVVGMAALVVLTMTLSVTVLIVWYRTHQYRISQRSGAFPRTPSGTTSGTPSRTPSRIPSPDRSQEFLLPFVPFRNGMPTNRETSRSPSRTSCRTPSGIPSRSRTPSEDSHHEGVGDRLEQNPSDAGPSDDWQFYRDKNRN